MGKSLHTDKSFVKEILPSGWLIHHIASLGVYSLGAPVYAITFSIFIIGRVRIVVRPHRRHIVSLS